MIKLSVFVIDVQDLEASAKYYRDVLGFAMREIGNPGWRMFGPDQRQTMEGECPDAIPAREQGDHSYFGCIVVDDVDDYYRKVAGNGVEIIKAPKDEPWNMREFDIRTIDGHRIMIGQ